MMLTPCAAHAWNLQDILNKAGEAMGNVQGSDITGAVGGIVEGLFTKSDIEVKDMAGTWTVKGSAVCFESDNLLQQAGGNAAAGVIENRLDPYYKKYGLTGSTLTIQADGTFSLQLKKIALTGTIEKQATAKSGKTQGGNFYFKFNSWGVTSLGSVNAYVTLGPTGMQVMFDANKLRAILNAIASFSKVKIAQSLTGILNQYEGLCVGFDLKH